MHYATFKLCSMSTTKVKALLTYLVQNCSGIQISLNKPKEFLAEFMVKKIFSVSDSRNTDSAVPEGPTGPASH